MPRSTTGSATSSDQSSSENKDNSASQGSKNNNSNSDGLNIKDTSIICTEVFDEHSNPTGDEVIEYARKIGIDADKEPSLLYLAREGLLKELPPEWKPCWDETIGDYYYFNVTTGSTQWGHPLDEIYRQKVIIARNNDGQLAKEDVSEEASDNTSDILSNSKLSMEPIAKPLKLGPLPPLGGGKNAGAAGSKRALPPLKKMPQQNSLSVSSSLEKSPMGSPNRSPLKNGEPAGKSLPLGPPESKGLSLKLGGTSFLKSQAGKETGHSDEESDSVQVKIVSHQENGVKSILKTSPRKADPNANLRAAMIARDEKRIQFNIEDESKNLVLTSEESESSAAIDEVKSSLPTKNDFLGESSKLSTPEKKAIPATKPNSSSSESSTKPVPVSRPPGTVPNAARPVTARSLSSTLKKEPRVSSLNSSSSSGSSSVEDDAVLQNIKFKTETLSTMQAKKKEITESAGSKGQLTTQKAASAGGINGLVGTTLNKESLTAQVTESVRKKHEEDIAKLKNDFKLEREKFEAEKEKQEKVLKSMFQKEMDSLKSKMEQDFAKQKTQLLKDFELKLGKERKVMEEEYQKKLEVKEEALVREMEALRADFDKKKSELEETLKSQLANDLADLRQELEKAKAAEKPPEIQVKHVSAKPKPKSMHNKSSHFLREIEGIESDIKQLRSQVKFGSTVANDSCDETASTLSEDDFAPNVYYKERRFHQQPRAHPINYEQACISPAPQDLSRTIEVLQQRVISLERNLLPFTVPYPTSSMSTFHLQPPGGQQAPSVHLNGFATTPTLAGLEHQPPRIINGWTVDEQIYKSKMWLKQRNAQMLPRS